jgi:hypothetical protein
MSSTTRMSSQRYIPYYSAIRREAQRKAPAQRRQTIILRREPCSQPGVDYRARKSALTIFNSGGYGVWLPVAWCVMPEG